MEPVLKLDSLASIIVTYLTFKCYG